jgi:hypothetical protein
MAGRQGMGPPAAWRLITIHRDDLPGIGTTTTDYPAKHDETFMTERGQSMFDICTPLKVSLLQKVGQGWEPRREWAR